MTLKQMAVISLNLMLAAVAMPAARGQEQSPSEYQVKAAFLYNFAKFVEWPPRAFASETAPLVIGVLGSGTFRSDLERTIKDKKIENHPIEVLPIKNLSELKDCHIVFISASENRRWEEIANALGDAPVLTVLENHERFTQTGGMINFFERDKKIRFEINHEAARKARLQISSKLLLLASRNTRV